MAKVCKRCNKKLSFFEGMGSGLTQYINIKFEKREDKTICIVKVESNPNPVF